MNDYDLITALQSSNTRGKAIKELYKEFPKIKANIEFIDEANND